MDKKKGTEYFGERQELAIKEFLSSSCEARKNELFAEIIDPAFKELVKGVSAMPKFQKIIGLYRDFDCEEGAYYHIIFNMHKFDPNRIGKDGKLVKAYSYFGTAVKNYILGLKIQADKQIAKHGGMIDVDEIHYDIKYNKSDIKAFEELKTQILFLLDDFKNKQKLTKSDLIVLNCLKYMLTNWHSLDFVNKNQFNRLLISYTQLSPNVVMNSLKKIKVLVTENSTLLNVKNKSK